MKLGFIGTGNMASAIMGGIIKNQIIPANDNIRTIDNFMVVSSYLNFELLFYTLASSFHDICSDNIICRDDLIIITIAPGKTLAWLKEQFGKNVKIVRTMPNTPALVGAGMTAACPNEYMTKEEIAYVLTLLESFGRVEIIPERLMDTVVSE